MNSAVLLWLVAVAQPVHASSSASEKRRLRIVYVVNSWWPKIDGAAIATMGHVAHFVASGHSVLVVKPSIRANEVLALEAERAGYGVDQMPAAGGARGERGGALAYAEFGTLADARAGGFEIAVDPLGLGKAERAIHAWLPDVVLVTDPCLFLFDAFRVPGILPGITSLRPAVEASKQPVTIASYTTHLVDGVFRMPDFWWLPRAAEPLLHAGVAVSYALFDHIFVNGEPTKAYLRDEAKLGLLGGPAGRSLDLAQRTTVVASRGVAADYCSAVPPEVCDASSAASRMRARPAGSLALLYVGRLTYDKYVDQLVEAFSLALADLERAPPPSGRMPTLYLVGSGELDALVREAAARHPGRIELLGSMQPAHIPCVLHEASAFISAAANETFGRAQVEALRCEVPLLLMTLPKGNMHVRHGINGLLGATAAALAEHIAAAVRTPALLEQLQAGAKASALEAGLVTHGSNAAMLDAVLTAHRSAGGDHRGAAPGDKVHWHLLWTPLFLVGRLIDAQTDAIAITIAIVVALLASVACFCRACCCRPRRPTRQGRGGGRTKRKAA